MRALFSAGSWFAVGLLLSSCLLPHMMSILVHPQLDGPYEPATTADVRQIIELSYSRSDIRQPIYRIYMEAADQLTSVAAALRTLAIRSLVSRFASRTDTGLSSRFRYQTEVIITS